MINKGNITPKHNPLLLQLPPSTSVSKWFLKTLWICSTFPSSKSALPDLKAKQTPKLGMFKLILGDLLACYSFTTEAESIEKIWRSTEVCWLPFLLQKSVVCFHSIYLCFSCLSYPCFEALPLRITVHRKEILGQAMKMFHHELKLTWWYIRNDQCCWKVAPQPIWRDASKEFVFANKYAPKEKELGRNKRSQQSEPRCLIWPSCTYIYIYNIYRERERIY